jgi:hypothetical protein
VITAGTVESGGAGEHAGPVNPSTGAPPLRIGHQERTAACAALDAHLEAGRLDPDEYGDRFARASIARTRAELDVLFSDLPAPHPAGASHKSAEYQRSSPWAYSERNEWRRFVPASALGRVMGAIALVLALGVIIPVVIVGGVLWLIVASTMSRHHYGRRRYFGPHLRPARW